VTGERARSLRNMVLGLTVFVVAGALSSGMARLAAHRLPRPEPLEELAYYPSGQWLTQAAMGESMAAADLLWLRAVQYYGQHRQTDNTFVHMAHVFDIITTLDPQFQNAYVFGGTSLCQEGRQFAAGVALLEKGARKNPQAWVYPFELGFVHYVGKRDLTRATFEFAQAARQPGAPGYCSRFAAWSGQRAGYEDVAIELWQNVAATTTNKVLREKACDHMRRLARGSAREAAVERWIRALPALEGDHVLGPGTQS
jgi:hypothetical protein